MDAISYSHSVKQEKRIKKFNTNPDSNSGVLTQPKVIEAGETVTIPAGRMAVLPNVQVDGTLTIEGEVFIPSGSSIDMGNGLAINGEKVVMSVPISYHLLQGNLAVNNTVITQGFNTTLYTGNGSTQSINTGIDMDTQWGDTAEEKFGGLVWLKNRNGTAADHRLIDTVRGATKSLSSSATYAEYVEANGLSVFNSNGFSIGALPSLNTNTQLQSSWNFQTTHRISGVTNHGKPYTCHYNPFTGFTIVKYEGSGLAGHEVPHHLGKKLSLCHLKNLSATVDWSTYYFDANNGAYLNRTDAFFTATTNSSDTLVNITGTGININQVGNTFILYGWANSYYDESNKLIGNYEIDVYQGTGAAQKIKTKGKPAWVMFKRIDSTGDWIIFDNNRSITKHLYLNLNSTEGSSSGLAFETDGITITSIANAQYLYMVAYDTNSDGGGSYYPKATDTASVQLNNALIPIAKGSDINGLKNVMLSKNETITGLTYAAGKNYIYYDGNGNKGVKSVAPNYGTTNPANGGDFYSILENKWYTSAGVEIPEGRNYLNHIVYADNDGGVIRVEELPKIEYKDIIKANEYQGKNACIAMARCHTLTTPITPKNYFNVERVVKIGVGIYDIYVNFDIDINKIIVDGSTTSASVALSWDFTQSNSRKIRVYTYRGDHVGNLDAVDAGELSVKIFGGRE